jgi:hypothetical protein
MSTHLITGKAGYEHVKASDHGALHAAIMGGGEFVLEGGEQFACQVISNNKVRIFDGEALMQGRHIRIDRNTYEETTHDNGVQGYKRIDLVVLTYTKDEGTGVENVALEVIKGTPSESNPSVPSYVTGDILNNGELKNQMPLYKIPFDGLSIGEPVAMFKTVPTMQTMKEEVDAKVADKIAEMDDAFADLEGSIDDKIAEAGKPLSSNASDWGMIANYGEYSADAKTVGEEFAKVSDSLTADNAQAFQFAYDSESGKYGYKVKEADTEVFVPFKSGGLIEAELPFKHIDIDCLAREYVTTSYRIDLTDVTTITFKANATTNNEYDFTYGLCDHVPTSTDEFELSTKIGLSSSVKSITLDVSAYSGYYYLCFYYYIGTGAYHAYVKDLIFA